MSSKILRAQPAPAEPFVIHAPLGDALPLVFDSPHSGFALPDDFGTVATEAELASSCDAFVDELWLPAVGRGATLLAACFPRAYIDPNRAADDIDAQLLAQPWPEPLQPRAYTLRGMGLIRRDILPGRPMYQRLLDVTEVQSRLDRYYRPYRQALARLLHERQQAGGRVWHIDCHSMKAQGNAMNVDRGAQRPDIVVSDGLGRTADPAFTAWVADALRERGFSVQVNDPYQGGDLVLAHGAPAQGVNSVQIELNRALYLDESRHATHAGFEALQRRLDDFSRALIDHVTRSL
ncbi:N-formylglutamate amidohydrolase [Amphibiibacter pelophylacis]|uniref:N-formylglutamate amidohydrolase n=1 Tax=Amphibiibacter pelophylacis TaxID=1799477 RepID=A0ACC6P4B3_9BURK